MTYLDHSSLFNSLFIIWYENGYDVEIYYGTFSWYN